MQDAALKNSNFDVTKYIKHIFNGKAEVSTPEIAAKIVQHIPRMIIDIANTDFFEIEDFVDLRSIHKLGQSFLHPDKGIQTIISTYNNVVSGEALKGLAETKSDEAFNIEEFDPAPGFFSERLKPYSSFTSTFQEFLAVDPTSKNIADVEQVEESKKIIYTTLNAIRAVLNPQQTIANDLIYEGVSLKLKAVPLSSIAQTDLDTYTRNLIIKSRSIAKQNSNAAGVTPTDNIVALVISNNLGAPIYFNSEGGISSKDEGGKLVYQFLRDARKKGDSYTVTDIYGKEDQIQDPYEIATKSYSRELGMSFNEYYNLIKTEQQEDFKKIYEFKEKVLADKQPVLLPFLGISSGLPESFGNKISLNKISQLSGVNRNTFKTIKTIQQSRGVFKKGFASILLDGNECIIDRADVPKEIALQVAQVLTNKNISFSERIDFYKQFFSNDLQATTRRHETGGKLENKEFWFNYSNDTSQEQPQRNFLDNSINLSQESIDNKTEAQLVDDAQRIYEVLMSGKGNTRRYPAKMNFNSELLKNERYMTYDKESDSIEFKDYIEFIKNLNTEISINSSDPGLFNAYMEFALPSQLLAKVDKVKAELKEDAASDTKNLKDAIVNRLKESGEVIDADVTAIKKGFYKVHYANFNVTVPGIEGEAKVYFQNKTALISKEGKTFQDPTWPAVGNLVRLVLRPELTTETGQVIADVVQVYAVNENGTQGAYLGNLAETEYGVKQETPRLEDEIEEQEVIATEEKETIPELEDRIILTSPIKPTSKISRAASLLNQNIKGLDRSAKLSGDVTVEDVEKANNWWNTSPLNKYITLDHAANLVNSDVFARFTVTGATLIDPTILANISIYQKGSMVDVYHEAWHGFSQLYLTEKEKLKLYNDIREYKDKSGNTPYANKSFFEIEEMIAEDFRTYAKDPKTFKAKAPIQKTIFQKILDFLYKLFGGKTNTKDVVVGNYPASVTEMFDALYLASKDPSLLNNYSPSIDNVTWDLLNRGVEKVTDVEVDVLTKQEANLISNTIDSILSDYVDANHDARVSNGKAVTKSGTLVLLSNEKDEDGITNRSKAYGYVKAVLEDRLDDLNDELGVITDKSFSELTTIEDLENESIAIIRSKEGEDKYIFLNSQVENFNNLTPDIKQGERVKGEKYKGSIEIISDFYKHNNILVNDKNVNVIIVNDVRDAKAQFDNYIKGGSPDFTSIEIKEDGPVYKELTSEQETLLDNIRILQNTINNWGDEKSGVMKYHANNSRFDLIRQKFIDIDYGDEVFDENGDPVDETDISDGNDSAGIVDKSVGKKSAEQFAGKETLYIVKSLFKIIKGKTVNNKLGFKELVDFNKVWGILLREVGGVKNREVAFKKLVEASLTYAPELKQLVEKKLPDPTKIMHTSEFDVSAAFWQDLSLSDIAYSQLTAFPIKEMLLDEQTGYMEPTITGFTMEVIDASIEPSNIIRSFQNEFKVVQPEDNPFITKVDNITMLTKLTSLVKTFEDKNNPGFLNVNKSYDFARAIGIGLDDLNVIKKELKDNSEYYGLPYIYQIVKDLAEIQSNPFNASVDAQKTLKSFVMDPLALLKSKIPKGVIKSLGGDQVYQKNILDRLAGLQAQFGLETKGKGIFNAAGDMVFPFVQDFSISRKIDALNSIENLTDCWIKSEFKYMKYLNPKVSSFTNYSQILKSVFNYETGKINEGQKDRRHERYLDLTMVSGTQVAEFSEGTNTSDLDKSSKFLQEMHTMLKGGLQEFIRAAGKKTSLGVRVKGGLIKDKGKDSSLYVDIDMFNKEQTGELYTIDKIMIPYIASEFERIQKFKNNREEFKKYTGYNKRVGGTKEDPIYAGEVFTAFDKVLSKDTKVLLLSNDVVKGITENKNGLIGYVKQNKDLRDAIQKDIIQYFNEQVSDNLNNLTNAKYIDPSLIEKTGNSKLTEQEQEYMLVKAFTYNSWIHNFETVNLFIGDMSQFNHVKEELHKRNTGSQSGGRKFLTDEWAQNFINNTWNQKTYAAKLAKTLGAEYDRFSYDGTFNTAIIKDIDRPSVYLKDIEKGLRDDYELSLKNSGKTKKEIKEIIDENIKKDLKSYKEMNEADGAGYITIDGYRTLKKLENNWSDKQEALFQDIINDRVVTTSEIEEFFPVYKLQNYGELLNDTLAPVTSMHKFALAPLIPSEIKNSELDHLHKEMLRNNIQYVTYESGSKVGGITSNGIADEVFTDSTQTKLKDKLTFTDNIIALEYLKNVTEVNNKFKGKIPFPTQLRGLILDGLYEQGKLSYEKHAELAKEYHDDVANYTEFLKIELLHEIQWEYKDGRYQGEFTKLLSLVQKELSKRDMPEHLIKMIGVNPDGSLKTDLSLHLEADTIEKMLLSVINKRLIKQKVKGESLVQVPSTMYNGLWSNSPNLKKATEDDVKKWMGSNNLPFYKPGANGNTDAMKVAIALQGDFINILEVSFNGERIGTIDRLNEAIKDDNWLNTGDNRQLVTLSGARIPIQNLNSLEFAEIYHFLDPAAGNKIVVPTEIVAKAGSDFDVDKLYFMMPHISSRGTYIKSSKTNSQLSEELASLKGEQIKDKTTISAKSLLSKQRAALENKLIASTASLLAIPENYASLVRPNDTYLLKPIADKIQKYVTEYNRYNVAHGESERINPNDETKRTISPTTTLEIGYNLDKHEKNMMAKAALGIDAQDNKQHPIWNSIGAKMPATYQASKFDDAQQKSIEGVDEYQTRLLLRHNTMLNSNGERVISLSHRYDQENIRIADTRSHKMNGQLDAEKDAWVADIQADTETTPVLNYLMNAGVPREEAIYFVANPLVREYGMQQKLLKSTFSTIINKGPVNENFILYKSAEAVVDKYIPEYIQKEIALKVHYAKVDTFLNHLKGVEKIQYATGFKFKTYHDTTVKKLKQMLVNDPTGYNRITGLYSIEDVIPDYDRSANLIKNDNYYYAATVASDMAGINPGDAFDKEDMIKIVETANTDPNNKDNELKRIAMFLHFIEIQKYIKGIGDVMRQANPDTKIVKTVQQIKKKEIDYINASTSSKIDADLLQDIREKSILSSFYLNDLSIDILEPLFPLRLNADISNYISARLLANKELISAKYGKGADGQEKFSSQFNNGVIQYIFQNYMSNFIDANGNVVSMPDVYRGMKIVKSKDLTKGVEISNDQILIDEKTLENDFRNQLYITEKDDSNNYTARGLQSFSIADDPFPSQSSYNRYVIEREFLRTKYPNETDLYLNKRALINVFNAKAIMGTNDYSYTDQVMEIINQYPQLKEVYPVLGQLSQAPYKNKEGENIKVLQLNDKKMAIGEVAEIYNQNLKQLGDVNIRKVKDDEDNKKISDIFKVFSLMMIHQHGVGFSKYGFPKILDEAIYVDVMRNASADFMANHINTPTLNTIFNKVVSKDQFQNYVAAPADYNNPSAGVYVNSIATELRNELQSYAITNGATEVNALLSSLDDVHIIRIPQNATNGLYLDNAYNTYAPLNTNTFIEATSMLQSIGVDIDAMPDLFYDFANDKEVNVSEFYDMIRPQLEGKVNIEVPTQSSTSVKIEPTDKIIFGHPGIGKTELKKNGRTDIIDFDSDYKTEINKKFNLPEGFKARNAFQKSNKDEYNQAVRELWGKAKEEANRTGKTLLASDMILLREFASDFDKVITMSKETFIDRAKQRNDFNPGPEGTEGWKNSLDKEISKVPVSKVITTDKYMSDLLPNQPSTSVKVISNSKVDYTRNLVENNPRTLYIFTDNTDRTSGNNPNVEGWYAQKYGTGLSFGTINNPTTAVIRGKDNAYPISTMKWFYKNHNVTVDNARWTDTDINQFKKVIDDEINQIKEAWNSGNYDNIIIPSGDGFFNSRIAKITKERTPALYNYLQESWNNFEQSLTSTQPSTEVTVPMDSVIFNFYSELTEKEKETLGNLAEIINDYVQMYDGTMSEEQYIETVLKCKL